MAEFKPDLIIYNAGTDILVGDPLGNLDISADGIKSRDELMFKTAKDHQIPIVMLTRFVFFFTSEVVIFILLLSCTVEVINIQMQELLQIQLSIFMINFLSMESIPHYKK